MDILTSIHGRRLGLGGDGSLILNHEGSQKIIRADDVPAAITASTLAVTKDDHAGKIVPLSRAAGIAVTLPAATGSGDKYAFLITTAVTSNATTIKVANASDTMVGHISTADATGGNGFQEAAVGTDDTISMNGTTTGGLIGSYVECVDIASNLWLIAGRLVGSGTLATSLSATVS